MKAFNLLFLALIFAACGTSQNVISESSDGEKPQRNVKIKAEIGDASGMESDWYSIDTAYIANNQLFLTISYSGGCAEHNYKAIASPAVSKSLPPKRGLKLIHDANGDSCRGMYQRIIEIDITELSVPNPHNETVIQLDGWKGVLIYKVK